MANKFGKFLLFSAVVGAAAAGAYYFLNREEIENGEKPDFAKDVDNFFDNKNGREYVDLKNIVSSEEKEALKNAVTEAAADLKEKAEEAAEDLGIVRDDSKEAEDFAFEEFKDEEKSE